MAKKSFSLDDVNSLLKESNSFGDIISNSDFTKTLEFIHTGNYHLNACFSGSLLGGAPSNKSICVSGDSGAGKTFLLLNMCKEAQNTDRSIIYYDTEGAVDIDSIKSFGIDPTRFNHQPVSDLAKFRTSITTLIKKLIEIKQSGGTIPKLMIVLDSLGMLATSKEIDDAISGNTAADMTRAKMIRSLFRIITSDLSSLGILFIYSNHTYQSQSFIPTINLSGGGGVIYAASIIANLTKAQIKEDAVKTGIIVSVNIMKNRYARPVPIKFHIRWDRGMNPYIGLETYIDWETCGIQKGSIINQKDYEKLSPADKEKASPMNEQGFWFLPKDTARQFICKHLGKGVSLEKLFTPEVFTMDIIKTIDEKKVKPRFSYGINESDTAGLEEFLINDEENE